MYCTEKNNEVPAIHYMADTQVSQIVNFYNPTPYLDYPEFPREKFKVESHLSTAKFVDFLTMCVSEMFITRYTRTEEIISLIFAYHCHYHIALSLC